LGGYAWVVNCTQDWIMLALAAFALSVPLYFEPNQGQAPTQVRYLATTSQYSLYLSDTAITTNFPNGRSLRMNLPRSWPAGLGSLPGKTHCRVGGGALAR